MIAISKWRRAQLEGAATGLAAAALFGVSVPLAKLLLPGTGPLLLASLLYLGAGVGLAAVGCVSRARSKAGAVPREARLRLADAGLTAGIVVAGGFVGPVLMLIGLQRVSAAAGSLLLNLEMPLTILLAVAFFGEHIGRRSAASGALIAFGAVILSYLPGEVRAHALGVAAIAGACLSWALDNNLTQRVSLRDPVAIARIKALGGGGIALALALASGHVIPHGSHLVGALALGFVSYGLSVALAIRAMRALGAARQGALMATAPLMGALAAVLLGERLGVRELAAFGFMAMGVALLLMEGHVHRHVHDRMEHDHAHVHDEHHQHAHGGESSVSHEPHAHLHVHEPLIHDHPHVSDAHHRHRH